MENDRLTFIACPTHNGEIQAGIVSAIIDAMAQDRESICFASQRFSKLTGNFNILLCEALNDPKFTHFLMIHGDIVPAAGWLKKMHAIMEEKEADVLSVVSPIKGKRGLTSTGLYLKEENAARLLVKRYTMKEIHKREETFTEPNILINTGLMLVDLRKEWIRNIHFHVTDTIRKMPDGKLKAFGWSEDWLFSYEAGLMGAKLYSTRAIRLRHVGASEYSNAEPFGIESEDFKEF